MNEIKSEHEQNEFWLNLWHQGRIHFHQKDFEAMLSRLPPLTSRTVFLPLCGKSKDLIYFRDKGHAVLGVELSATACFAFFEENNIAFSRQDAYPFQIFQSEGITIYQGDFFSLGEEHLQEVDVVYDRAALIALPESTRKRYVEHLIAILPKQTSVQVFLIALEHDSQSRVGPPYSVSANEIANLYSSTFNVSTLHAEHDQTFLGSQADGVKPMVRETLYRMVRVPE